MNHGTKGEESAVGGMSSLQRRGVEPCSAKVFLSSLCIIQGLNQQGVKSYGETNVPSTTQKTLI